MNVMCMNEKLEKGFNINMFGEREERGDRDGRRLSVYVCNCVCVHVVYVLMNDCNVYECNVYEWKVRERF